MANIQHKDIPEAHMHEPKHIQDSLQADSGKVITPSSSQDGTSELRKLRIDELLPIGRTAWTGWAQYQDSVYTEAAPLTIEASTRTLIEIDGEGDKTNVSGMPVGVSSLWDSASDKFTPIALHDAYTLRLSFTGKLDSAIPQSYVYLELDVGGSLGVIATVTQPILKDNNNHSYLFNLPLFVGSTFLANGGRIYITPSAKIHLWDFQILAIRTHAGS